MASSDTFSETLHPRAADGTFRTVVKPAQTGQLTPHVSPVGRDELAAADTILRTWEDEADAGEQFADTEDEVIERFGSLLEKVPTSTADEVREARDALDEFERRTRADDPDCAEAASTARRAFSSLIDHLMISAH